MDDSNLKGIEAIGKGLTGAAAELSKLGLKKDLAEPGAWGRIEELLKEALEIYTVAAEHELLACQVEA